MQMVLPIYCAALVVLLFLAWYYGCMAVARRRAILILRQLELALAGEGHITSLRWTSDSCFSASVRLGSRIFQNASMLVEMAPRHFPWQWWRFARRGGEETLTFCADLDGAPGFELRVVNQRWYGKPRRRKLLQEKDWEMVSCQRMVLSSRNEWSHEIASLVNALLATRHQEVSRVCFANRSPQFSATFGLQSLPLLAEQRPSVVDCLRELARQASAHQS